MTSFVKVGVRGGLRAMRGMRRGLTAAALAWALVGAAVPARAAVVSIVQNGDFEAGTTAWSGFWSIGDFSRGMHGTASARNAGYGAGAVDTAVLWQTLPTTPGSTYDLTFYLYVDGYAGGIHNYPNQVRVRWGGTVVEDIVDFATTNTSAVSMIPGGPMTLITVSGLVATSSSTVLSFGGRHDNASIFVDDVFVVLVPEPASLSLLGLAGLTLKRRRR